MLLVGMVLAAGMVAPGSTTPVVSATAALAEVTDTCPCSASKAWTSPMISVARVSAPAAARPMRWV